MKRTSPIQTVVSKEQLHKHLEKLLSPAEQREGANIEQKESDTKQEECANNESFIDELKKQCADLSPRMRDTISESFACSIESKSLSTVQDYSQHFQQWYTRHEDFLVVMWELDTWASECRKENVVWNVSDELFQAGITEQDLESPEQKTELTQAEQDLVQLIRIKVKLTDSVQEAEGLFSEGRNYLKSDSKTPEYPFPTVTHQQFHFNCLVSHRLKSILSPLDSLFDEKSDVIATLEKQLQDLKEFIKNSDEKMLDDSLVSNIEKLPNTLTTLFSNLFKEINAIKAIEEAIKAIKKDNTNPITVINDKVRNTKLLQTLQKAPDYLEKILELEGKNQTLTDSEKDETLTLLLIPLLTDLNQSLASSQTLIIYQQRANLIAPLDTKIKASRLPSSVGFSMLTDEYDPKKFDSRIALCRSSVSSPGNTVSDMVKDINSAVIEILDKAKELLSQGSDNSCHELLQIAEQLTEQMQPLQTALIREKNHRPSSSTQDSVTTATNRFLETSKAIIRHVRYSPALTEHRNFLMRLLYQILGKYAPRTDRSKKVDHLSQALEGLSRTSIFAPKPSLSSSEESLEQKHDEHKHDGPAYT